MIRYLLHQQFGQWAALYHRGVECFVVGHFKSTNHDFCAGHFLDQGIAFDVIRMGVAADQNLYVTEIKTECLYGSLDNGN